MAQTFDADVIIAGAGMAGATLALALKSGGLEPLLIDPIVFDDQLAPTFDGRASAIAFASFRQWRTLGLAAEIEPYAQRIEQILVTDGFAPGAAAPKPTPFFLQFDSAEIADRSDGEPLGYMMENRRTRAALAAGVGRAKIRVEAPAKVAAVEVETGAAKVRLE
ncbi:MAG TPA: FAD-dependent monooxygenase, partial [Phenylobacterium sp.]